MSTIYVNTSPVALIGTHPRGVYRATLARTGLARVKLVSWPDAVRDTLEKAGMSGYGIALGTGLPGATDSVGIIELRAKTAPGSSDSVGDLAAAIDGASPYTELVRLERLAPVPAAGSADADTRAATREAEAVRADRVEASESIGARFSMLAGSTGRILAGALVVIVVALAIYYVPRGPGSESVT